MVIERIELDHFRNYDHLRLFPHEGINLFFGQNGSGKTNLLEAVHYCALGKSHRISQDTHAVMAGQKSCSCVISVRGRYARNDIGIQLVSGEASVKSVTIDRKKVRRLSEMMGVLRCVIFSPEDLGLIREGPGTRRRFLDMMISQMNRPYFIALQQYRLAMEQRNAILRNCRLQSIPIDPMIGDFEYAMAEQAMVIYSERKKITEKLSQESARIYGRISGRQDEMFSVQYRAFSKGDGSENYLDTLRSCREEDLRQGLTTQGPHRDDLILTLNRKSMKLFASQGQVRTGALSLKLAQLRILTMETGESPVLLLDDVMSELDLQRRMNLLAEIGDTQTFITFSDEGDLEQSDLYRTYAVSSQDGLARIEERKTGHVYETPVLREPDFS